MTNSMVSILSSAATIVLIVVITRWLSSAQGAQSPRTKGDLNVYGIKWPLKALAVIAVVFCVVLSFWFWRDGHHPDWTMIGITALFVTIGFPLGTGSVETNQAGIRKVGVWRSRFFRWSEITEIRLHTKQGGAIELRADSRKLIVDSRFIAFQHLLKEIEDRTQKQAITA